MKKKLTKEERRKKYAPQTKTILAVEAKQARENMFKDNWFIAGIFTILGFALGLLV